MSCLGCFSASSASPCSHHRQQHRDTPRALPSTPPSREETARAVLSEQRGSDHRVLGASAVGLAPSLSLPRGRPSVWMILQILTLLADNARWRAMERMHVEGGMHVKMGVRSREQVGNTRISRMVVSLSAIILKLRFPSPYVLFPSSSSLGHEDKSFLLSPAFRFKVICRPYLFWINVGTCRLLSEALATTRTKVTVVVHWHLACQ